MGWRNKKEKEGKDNKNDNGEGWVGSIKKNESRKGWDERTRTEGKHYKKKWQQERNIKKKWGKEGLQEGMTTGKEGKDHKNDNWKGGLQ